MPKVSLKKTKSALKSKKAILGGVVALVGLFIVLLPTIFYQAPTAKLQAGGKTISLEVAKTNATRAKGLGGRESMATDKGMLFIFGKPAVECFWMKDMQFSIDMVWLDANKKVVHVESNVAPDTYPESFCPSANAKYVVELNAGQAAQLGISTGKTLAL